MRSALVILAVLAIAAAAKAAEPELTYADLVGRLTDLQRLATLPSPGERCAQWSSYDRRSRYDRKTGNYVNWSANGDGGGVIRREDGEVVLAEMQGPGCIWRIWSAAPGDGHVRIHLDGASEPAVDLPFRGYLDRKNEPFTRPSLVYVAARGWNCYVPIPYRKSCRIVADPKWGRYYHFTYSTFPPGTKVATFQRTLGAAEAAALDEADRILGDCGRDPAGRRPGEQVLEKTVHLDGGTSATVAKLSGPRAITALRVRLDLPASPADRIVLRELALRITWDDEKRPAVWAPLGDFFGTAAGANRYRSLPMGLAEDGTWYSFWYMPFAESATVELANDGKAPRKVQFEITHAPAAAPIQRLGRFHAKWHRDAPLPAEPERRIDWAMLKAAGGGRFVGVMLHVWNPRGGWWGEGDEKFFVDAEKFPSTFGTGSEDYFGYAWCTPQRFSRAFHSQTIAMDNRGHVSVNRWHVADNVPFATSFEGCIERYFPDSRPTVYACIAYWYQAAGGQDPYRPAPLERRVGYWSARSSPDVSE